MTERVSDGLLAALKEKMDDGTPRGIIWPTLASMGCAVFQSASTPEEVAAANEALVALIAEADEHALREMELQASVDQLRSYLDGKRGA